jgi:hypothetical protein
LKLRNGFVSNSSTSSFVVIGFLVDSCDSIDDIALVEEFGCTCSSLTKKINEYKSLLGLPEKSRGCEHAEMDANFCPECGKPMWVESKSKERINDLRMDIHERVMEGLPSLSFHWGDSSPVDGKFVVGFTPIHISEGCVGSEDFDFEDVAKKVERIREAFGIAKDVKPKIIGGTYAS